MPFFFSFSVPESLVGELIKVLHLLLIVLCWIISPETRASSFFLSLSLSGQNFASSFSAFSFLH